MKQEGTRVIKATIMWASFDKVNQMTGAYGVELTNLSPQAVAGLEELGIEARQNNDKPEKGFFISVKSKYPIVPRDVNGDDILDPVGNGSEAHCVVGSYAWKFKNKEGVSPSLKALKITKLVRYDPEDAFATDDEVL